MGGLIRRCRESVRPRLDGVHDTPGCRDLQVGRRVITLDDGSVGDGATVVALVPPGDGHIDLDRG